MVSGDSPHEFIQRIDPVTNDKPLDAICNMGQSFRYEKTPIFTLFLFYEHHLGGSWSFLGESTPTLTTGLRDRGFLLWTSLAD